MTLRCISGNLSRASRRICLSPLYCPLLWLYCSSLTSFHCPCFLARRSLSSMVWYAVVYKYDLDFCGSMLATFIHIFSKASCTMSCANSLSRVLCRMKRYTPSAWVSTHVLYSCVVTLGKVRRQVCDSLLLPKVTGFGVDFDK